MAFNNTHLAQERFSSYFAFGFVSSSEYGTSYVVMAPWFTELGVSNRIKRPKCSCFESTQQWWSQQNLHSVLLTFYQQLRHSMKELHFFKLQARPLITALGEIFPSCKWIWKGRNGSRNLLLIHVSQAEVWTIEKPLLSFSYPPKILPKNSYWNFFFKKKLIKYIDLQTDILSWIKTLLIPF